MLSPGLRPHTTRRLVAALAVTATAAGPALSCGGTSGSDAAPTSQRSSATETSEAPTDSSSTTTTEEPRGELGSGETVRIAFGGDSSFTGLEGALSGDPGAVLSAVAPTLQAADLAIVNLEAALATGGSPEPKAFNFRVPPAALSALSAAGVDAVTMANNHGMDFGAEGFSESLLIRSTSQESHGVAVVGIGGHEDDAYSPYVTEVKGQRIGLIGVNDVFDSTLEAAWTAGPEKPGLASAKAGDRMQRLLAEVGSTRAEVDTLIVYLHMGREKETCPNARQVEIADALHAAGADVVVGSHAHRLQGAGFRNGEFVAYGMGNYIFGGPAGEGRKSGTLTVDVTGQRVDGFAWEPALIQGNVPVPLQGEAAMSALAELEALRECAGLQPAPAPPPSAGTAGSEVSSGTEG